MAVQRAGIDESLVRTPPLNGPQSCWAKRTNLFGVVLTGVATVIKVKGIRWVKKDPRVLEKSEAGFCTCRINGRFFFFKE